MSAQDLTFAELGTATATIAGSGPPGDWWRGSNVGRLFGAEFDARRAVIVRAPAESSEAGRIVNALAEEDAVHDREVRFGDGLLELIEEHHWVLSMRVDAAMLRALLFPDGVALVNKTYAEEAGRGAARGAMLTPEVRAKLALIPVLDEPGGVTNMEQWVDRHLQPSSARLGTLLAQRAAAASDGSPTPAELLEAKRGFISVVTHVFATFRALDAQLSETDRVQVKAMKATWSDAVRVATERVARRRAARAAASVVVPPVAG